MAVRRPTARTSTNSIHKMVEGKTIWLHQDSFHNIVDLHKYGKQTLYGVMRRIVKGTLELPVPEEFKSKPSYHFIVKEDKTLQFENY
jgi:hypothetical protein